MVLSLMSAAMLASLVSRMFARPLYETLANYMVMNAMPAPPSSEPAASPPPSETQPTAAPAAPQDDATPQSNTPPA